jgi:HAE1 family hydrophobic/amphiphilic exporter-1
MAIIGGVILVGVVVNHGIVLIDQVQGLRRAGASREEALTEAARTRLRPILMTSLTTIGGLIPMAIGGTESVGIDYRPLGRVVIGGMVSSTLLTLIVVPLFYTLLDDLSRLPQRLRGAQEALKRLARRA